MTPDSVLDLFRQSGALLEGHFRLSSGLHSTGYLQCALVLQHPQHAEALGAALADRVTRGSAADMSCSRRRSAAWSSATRSARALGVRAHLRRAAGRHADAAPRLHARRRRSRPRRRGRGHDRRITRETMAVAQRAGAQVVGGGLDHRSRRRRRARTCRTCRWPSRASRPTTPKDVRCARPGCRWSSPARGPA